MLRAKLFVSSFVWKVSGVLILYQRKKMVFHKASHGDSWSMGEKKLDHHFKFGFAQAILNKVCNSLEIKMPIP